MVAYLDFCGASNLAELEVLDQIPHYVPISAHLEWNLDELLERMWEYLSLVRMYVIGAGALRLSHTPYCSNGRHRACVCVFF